MRTLRVILSGIGGYGAQYLHALAEVGEKIGLSLAGVVQPGMERYPQEEAELRQRRIPVDRTLELLLAQTGPVDLCVIASPIQHHYEQCWEALNHGCNVLCEKPLTSDYAQALVLEELARAKGLTLAVGFQQCYSGALVRLKQDVVNGRFGRAVFARGLSLIPRSDQYFKRNDWAGCFFDAEGRSVMDGVLHNSASGDLQVMLYLLGGEVDASATVCTLRGEWCRANKIRSYDTAAVQMTAVECPNVFFAASHAWAGATTKRCRIQWEQGFLEGDWARDGHLVVRAEDETIDYGTMDVTLPDKLRMVADCLREDRPVPCTVRGAKAEVATACGLYLSAGRVTELHPSEVQMVRGAPGTPDEGCIYSYAPELIERLEKCWQTGQLPADLGKPLGGAPRTVTLEDILHGPNHGDA